MKHKNYKFPAKAVAAILCAALVLTACGSRETAATETAPAESTEVTTEAAGTEPVAANTEPAATPTVEPTEAPTEAPADVTTATTADSTVEPTAEPTAAPADAGYTYTELSQTMYAKSAVNVRDLPSTDGEKIGSLKASQEITVTGKCDQTGWYRFDLNGTTAYASDKYIVSEKPVVNTGSTSTANTGNSNTAGNQYVSNTVDDTFGITEEQIENFMKTHGEGATGSTTTNPNEYFDRAMAEQVFAMVNAERSAAGIPELTWSEDLYNIAMERCHENDGHASVRPGTGENCQTGAFGDDNANASTIHQNWKNSQGHYDNYMNAMYGTGAVAILRKPGNLGGIQLGDGVVAYEVFANADS